MSASRYDQPASTAAAALVSDLFALGGIGYVALGSSNEVLMRLAPGLETTTTDETNFYEEFLVNPTLLQLAGRRGGLDCGGLAYIAVGYCDFTQLIMPMRDGHVSVGVRRDAPVRELAGRIQAVLVEHGREVATPASTLLA